MSSPVLKVQNLSASYGKKRVIESLDLEVVEGEIFGLVGLNGAGKTTMIKAVLGMGRASGDIRIFDRPAGPQQRWRFSRCRLTPRRVGRVTVHRFEGAGR